MIRKWSSRQTSLFLPFFDERRRRHSFQWDQASQDSAEQRRRCSFQWDQVCFKILRRDDVVAYSTTTGSLHKRLGNDVDADFSLKKKKSLDPL